MLLIDAKTKKDKSMYSIAIKVNGLWSHVDNVNDFLDCHQALSRYWEICDDACTIYEGGIYWLNKNGNPTEGKSPFTDIHPDQFNLKGGRRVSNKYLPDTLTRC